MLLCKGSINAKAQRQSPLRSGHGSLHQGLPVYQQFHCYLFYLVMRVLLTVSQYEKKKYQYVVRVHTIESKFKGPPEQIYLLYVLLLKGLQLDHSEYGQPIKFRPVEGSACLCYSISLLLRQKFQCSKCLCCTPPSWLPHSSQVTFIGLLQTKDAVCLVMLKDRFIVGSVLIMIHGRVLHVAIWEISEGVWRWLVKPIDILPVHTDYPMQPSTGVQPHPAKSNQTRPGVAASTSHHPHTPAVRRVAFSYEHCLCVSYFFQFIHICIADMFCVNYMFTVVLLYPEPRFIGQLGVWSWF